MNFQALVYGVAIASILALSSPLRAQQAHDHPDSHSSYVAAYKAYKAELDAGHMFFARQYSHEAVELASKKLEADHKTLLVLRINRMKVHVSVGPAVEDFNLRSEALTVPRLAREIFGDLSIEHIDATFDAAKILAKDSSYRNRGTRLLRKLLSDAEAAKAENKQLLAELNMEIARHYYSIGRGHLGIDYLDDAVALYKKTVEGKELAYTTGQAELWRAKIDIQRKSKKRALRYLETAMEKLESAAPASMITLHGHAMGVSLYSELGLPELATKHCRKIASVKAGDATQGPLPLYRIHPKYPAAAARFGKEGHVIVEFDVDDAGQPENTRVLEVKGHKSFAKEALKALKQYRYVPGFENGEPKPVKGLQYKFAFKMARR